MNTLTTQILLLPLALSLLLPQAPSLFAQADKGKSQKKETPARTDLTAAAAALALRAGFEADKLSARAGRLELKLEAARIAARTHPQDALQLLDSAWKELKECPAKDGPDEKGLRAEEASALRSDALSLYAKLDQVLAERLQKQLPTCEKEGASGGAESKEAEVDQSARGLADGAAKIALALAEKEPDKAAEAALSGLRSTGKVSGELRPFLHALAKAGHETVLRKTEEEIARILSHRVSVEPSDHMTAAALMSADPRTSAPVRASLAGYLTRSLESVRAAIRESQITKQPLPLDPSLLGYLYTSYLRTIRPAFSQSAPDKIQHLDSLLAEIAPVLTPSWQERAYQASPVDPPEKQLARALQTADGKLRDLRLLDFAFRALAGTLRGVRGRQIGLAASAVDSISHSGVRQVMRDYLLIAEAEKLAAEKNIPLATEKANAVSNPDWRAWALIGIGASAPRQQGEVIQLYEAAERALRVSRPSPLRVELAFTLASLWAEHDQARAFESLEAAVKYSNGVAWAGGDDSLGEYNLGRFYSQMGKLRLALWRGLREAGELTFGGDLSRPVRLDWARLEQHSSEIRDAEIRLRFQLAISRAALQPSPN